MALPLRIIVLILVCFLSGNASQAQNVVVSEYHNDVTPATEWTELLVVADNTSLSLYTLTDNNQSQSSRQGGVIFNAVSLWAHLRAGTIIVIHHRGAAATDVDGSDGYIEVGAENAVYFTKYFNGVITQWDSKALDISNPKDIVELLNASGNHVHALSHSSSTPGSYYDAMAAPKACYNGAVSVADGTSVQIIGSGLQAYAAALTSTDASVDLAPTKGYAGSSANQQYWLSLREPAWTSPAINASVIGLLSAVQLTWTAATDAYATDGTIGYMVLRNTTNAFTAPVDGMNYTAGSTLGSATIVTLTNSSLLTLYTDLAVTPCETGYYYRIYAFRYASDQLNGNNFRSERGRSWNQTSYAGAYVNGMKPVTSAITR